MLSSRSAIATLPLFLLLAACGSGEAPSADSSKASAESDDVPTVEERYLTERDENDNVDSVAVWHGPDGQNWLLATAKESDLLQVFDAATGELIRKVGSRGDDLSEFRRPNGISIIDDLALVVERDNHRVHDHNLTLQPHQFVALTAANCRSGINSFFSWRSSAPA